MISEKRRNPGHGPIPSEDPEWRVDPSNQITGGVGNKAGGEHIIGGGGIEAGGEHIIGRGGGIGSCSTHAHV